MTLTSTETLARHIAEKLRCLSELRDLGRRQMEVIQQDQIAQLLKVLLAKQHLIQQLTHIEAALDPFRHEDPDQRVWKSADIRERCARQAELCRRLLDEIVHQEQQSESRLTARRDQIATQLEQMQSASQVHTAYLAHDHSSMQRVDLPSET